MIDSRELRLGNIVSMPSSGKPTTITAMDISDIESNLKNRLGLPLTEGWLLKLGFLPAEMRPEGDTNWAKDYDLDNVYFGRITKVYKNEFEYIGLANDGLFYSVYEGIAADESVCLFMYGVALQFVHSLQNAWPFITGQELQLTT